MQFERSIFRLYDFSLRKLKIFIFLILITSTVIFSYKTILRINYSLTSSTQYFSSCMEKYYMLNNPQVGQFMSENSLVTIIPVFDLQLNECKVHARQNKTQIKSEGMVLFTDQSLLQLNQEIRATHNIQQTQIQIDINQITTPLIYNQFGIYQILIDQLSKQLTRKKIKQVQAQDFSNKESYINIKDKFLQISQLKKFFYKLIGIVFVWVKIIWGSICCGLFVLMIIISLYGLHISIIQILTICMPSAANLVQFPWIQHHLIVLRNADKHKNKVFLIIFGFASVFFLLAFGLSGVIKTISGVIIGGYYSQLNRKGVIFISILQIINLIFSRTRTSIKFLPTFTFIIYSIFYFLEYIFPYSLPLYFFEAAFHLSLITFMLFILFVQNKVSNVNNVQKYKPTYDRPRTLFFPIYNIGWHYTIPSIWTYFVPPYPRQYFTQNELSYVDKNYQKLYGLLLGISHPVALPEFHSQINTQPEQVMMI